ncbi:MAG: hypothetical protein FWF59_00720 [Turicibacter sp.]|nr:hypothetical protein [Turicibacter sp.]
MQAALVALSIFLAADLGLPVIIPAPELPSPPISPEPPEIEQPPISPEPPEIEQPPISPEPPEIAQPPISPPQLPSTGVEIKSLELGNGKITQSNA